MKTLIFIFSVLFSFSTLFADETSFKSLEKNVSEEVSKGTLPKDKLIHLYLLLGREALLESDKENAKKYYELAQKIEVSENKSEAYINLISLTKGEERKKLIADYSKYLEKNTEFSNKELATYLEYLKTGKIDEDLKPYLGFYDSAEKLASLIKAKDYLSAYALLNPKGIERSAIPFKITYDLLNVLVNKSVVKQLYCQETLEKYPEAYSYSVKICKVLSHYLKTKTVSKNDLLDVQKFYDDNPEEDKSLFIALKDLK